MPITASSENKNTALTASLENKVGDTIIWADAVGTWEENEGTWDNPETAATLESKSSVITGTLESKN